MSQKGLCLFFCDNFFYEELHSEKAAAEMDRESGSESYVGRGACWFEGEEEGTDLRRAPLWKVPSSE